MENISTKMGTVLRQTRRLQNISLDEAAALTGVSKAMLGQIERGESNPTVSTMWKIASGLKITFSSLMEGSPNSYDVVSLGDLRPVYEAQEKMVLYSIFPFDPVSGFEYLHIELAPGCDYLSPSHANVREEYIIVTQGILKLTVNGEVFMLKSGSSIKFNGCESHAYANPANEITVFQNVLRY